MVLVINLALCTCQELIKWSDLLTLLHRYSKMHCDQHALKSYIAYKKRWHVLFSSTIRTEWATLVIWTYLKEAADLDLACL